MNKTINRIKSMILGGAVAVSALAAPLSTTLVAPSLSVSAADTDDYARLLQYSLYFYDTNMCGEINGKTAISWRSNCHTSDEVKGGFHDAGDHAMFGLPQGYAASVLGWSYYEFKDAYNATGQGDHLKVITDYFCDFFKRSTKLNGNSVSSFLYQKGDGNEDHGYWGAPEQQGGGRKMFWTSNSASDIAADYAAALALNYLNFGNAEDLKYAEALYNFSTQHNKCEPNGTTGFYYLDNCTPVDEQANAAGWLYLATKNEKYKNDCASKQTQYLGWCDSWDNRGLGAACVYAHITNDWSKVNSYLGSLCNGSNYLCMDDWGSARYNCSVQMSAIIASKNSNADYTNWCKGQMNYLLGQNNLNVCFVTGFSSNSAKNTHHRAASGYQGYEGEYGFSTGTKTYHPTNGKTLIGALAGGPASDGTYSDVIDDYKCNEVAIDYNAGLVGAAAGLYEVYKTGKIASSIEGVTKIYDGPGSDPITTTTTTTTTTKGSGQSTTTTTTAGPGPSNNDVVLTPADMTVGTEKGDDGETNNYAEFKPQGAKSATLYYKVNSNDMNTSGAFGTWTGKWEQVNFDDISVPSDKVVKVDYDIPSNVGSTVKAMVFWPHGDSVTIEKVVLHMDGASSTTTTTTKTTTTTTTTSKTTTTTTTSKTTTTTTTSNPPTPGKKTPGDANCDGKVLINDAILVMQAIGNPDAYGVNGSENTHITAQGIANADVVGNNDGITTADAIEIQKYIVKLINSLN